MRSLLALLLFVLPVAGIAQDQWIPIGTSSPPIDALLLNVGYVVMNGNNNRVATIRSVTGGFRMDVLTEFDCRARRQRSLSSALSDKGGHLVSASAGDDHWFSGKDALGLDAACSAPIAKP